MALTVPGLDYAWGHPNYSCLHPNGYRFAMRYLSYDSGKNLNASDLKNLLQNGIDVGVVWETTATRAASGYAAGQSDAREASRQAANLGLRDIPIYFAVDFDANPSQVRSYFQGAVSVLGKARVGVYAGVRVITDFYNNGTVQYFWQTLAWSYGHVHPRAHIYQNGLPRSICGLDADPDIGQSGLLIGVRGPNQKPLHPYASRTLKPGDTGTDVQTLQAALNVQLHKDGWHGIVEDGQYGPATERARHHALYYLGFPGGNVAEHLIWPRAQRWVANPNQRPATYKARAALRKGKK